jgi:peptidoglycan hydrolase-like protein with peptidoglycan-binding domain
MANPIFIIDIGPDGVVATNPKRVELPVLIAPVPEEKKTKDFNTVRPHLVTIGCMMLPGRGFEFDSSFVGPQSANRFRKFADLMLALQKQDDADPKRFPPCSVFGHADPTGTDEYNKVLSGRRARAVYALLTRNTKIWESLYSNPFGGDVWGLRSIRAMLSVSLKEGEPPFFTGPLEPGTTQAEKQALEKQTREAIAAYQESRGLFPPGKGTGVDGPKTRELLFAEYMDAICRDSTGKPFQLDASKDFLTRNRDGAGLKGDVQGCGEFNQIFLLSQEEEELAKKDKVLEAVRNEIYRANRRVLVYIFKQGAEIDPVKWPCPRATEGPHGCTLRFWSDHKDRRKQTAERRTFGEKMPIFERDEDGNLILDAAGNPTPIQVDETGNTLACRWYHGFAVHSPCERKMQEWVVRIRIDSTKKDPIPLVGRRFVVFTGDVETAAVIRGTTNDKGEIRIPVFDEHVRMILKLDAWGKLFSLEDDEDTGKEGEKPEGETDKGEGFDTDAFPDEDKFMKFVLDGGKLRPMEPKDDELPTKQRLYNLGFGSNAPDKWTEEELKTAVRQYRKSRGLGKDSQLDGPTRIQIQEEHEGADEPPPEDEAS